MRQRRTLTFIFLLIFLFLLISLCAYVILTKNTPEPPPPSLQVRIFQLQSGVSVLIITPENKRIVINGGSNQEVIRHLTKSLPFHSRRVDYIFATTPEPKNVTGLIALAERFPIVPTNYPQAFIPAGISNSGGQIQIFNIFLNTLNEQNLLLRELEEGDSFNLDSQTKIDVIFPATSTEFQYSNASAPELVLRIEYGKTSFLIMGGISAKIQKHIASGGESGETGQTLKSDVLIATRNISADISEDFLKKVNPEYIVYSKTAEKISKKAQSSLRKKPNAAGVFSGMPPQNVVNTKEVKKTVFISDGSSVKIAK